MKRSTDRHRCTMCTPMNSIRMTRTFNELHFSLWLERLTNFPSVKKIRYVFYFVQFHGILLWSSHRNRGEVRKLSSRSTMYTHTHTSYTIHTENVVYKFKVLYATHQFTVCIEWVRGYKNMVGKHNCLF